MFRISILLASVLLLSDFSRAESEQPLKDLRLFLELLRVEKPEFDNHSNKGDTWYRITVSKDLQDHGVAAKCELHFDDSDITPVLEQDFHRTAKNEIAVDTYLGHLWSEKMLWPTCRRDFHIPPRKD